MPSPEGTAFSTRLRTNGWDMSSKAAGIGSAAIDGEGDGAEQVLKRPAGGEVNADTARGVADAGADFKELGAQSLDLCRAPGLRQLVTEEVDQVVGGGMQEQAESVGQEAVAAQAVGTESVLELLDAVLALAPVVVESETSEARPAQLVIRKRRLVPVAVCSAL